MMDNPLKAIDDQILKWVWELHLPVTVEEDPILAGLILEYSVMCLVQPLSIGTSKKHLDNSINSLIHIKRLRDL